jgi:hypothetical protein
LLLLQQLLLLPPPSSSSVVATAAFATAVPTGTTAAADSDEETSLTYEVDELEMKLQTTGFPIRDQLEQHFLKCIENKDLATTFKSWRGKRDHFQKPVNCQYMPMLFVMVWPPCPKWRRKM